LKKTFKNFISHAIILIKKFFLCNIINLKIQGREQLMKKDYIIIQINQKQDFKLSFGDIYCETISNNRQLKNEFKCLNFIFLIKLGTDFKEILNQCYMLKFSKEFSNIKDSILSFVLFINSSCSNLRLIQSYISQKFKKDEVALKKIFSFYEVSDKNRSINIHLNSEGIMKIYHSFYELFLNKPNQVKTDFLGWDIYFFINRGEFKFFAENPIYLQEIILFSTNNDSISSKIKIAFERPKGDNEYYYKIFQYLSNFKKLLFYYDGGDYLKAEVSRRTGVVTLFPLMKINKETYEFLKYPLNETDWDKLIGPSINDYNNYNDFIIGVCQKYLFSNFQQNESSIHQKLRSLAFLNKEFKKVISNIPRLALLIFSQYDFFSRECMQASYNKSNYRLLDEKDYVKNLQGYQSFKNYSRYCELKKEGEDIKSLISWEGNIKIIEIVDNYINSSFQKYFHSINEEYVFNLKPTACPNLFFLLVKSLYKINIDKKEIKDVGVQIENLKCAKKINEKDEYQLKNVLNKSQLKNHVTYFINDLIDSRNINVLDVQLHKVIDTIKLSQEILSEVFEATSIAEGLLQIIENGILYAKPTSLNESNCLFSMKVYKFNDEDDVSYLENEYEIYLSEKNKFYLEMILSDYSEATFASKFISNMKQRNNEDFQSLYYDHKNVIDNLVVKSFFSPTIKEEKMWDDYYKISNNQIHHYGLQIFSTIINSRKGVFKVINQNDSFSPQNEVGYKTIVNEINNNIDLQYDFYQKMVKSLNIDSSKEIREYMDDFIELHKNVLFDRIIDNDTVFFPGTSYHILLPLNRVIVEDNNVGNSILSKNNSYVINDNVLEYKISQINEEISEIFNNQTNLSKEEIITELASIINSFPSFSSSKTLCIYFDESLKYDLEILVKTLLLCFYDKINKSEENFILIITGLSTHQLLESVRIFALFLNKNKNKNMNLQIFLKGKRVGEEVILIGNDVDLSAQYLRKTSMMRGMMSEIVDIVEQLLLPLN